jgi:hypothetical protein
MSDEFHLYSQSLKVLTALLLEEVAELTEIVKVTKLRLDLFLIIPFSVSLIG